MLRRDVHSTYGPTADTGGLFQQGAPVIYAYPDSATLLSEETGERRKVPLPPPTSVAVTERPA